MLLTFTARKGIEHPSARMGIGRGIVLSVNEDGIVGRRALIAGGVMCALGIGLEGLRSGTAPVAGNPAASVPSPVPPLRPTVPAAPRIHGPQPRPRLLARAMASLDRHRRSGARRDRIALVDFSQPSSMRRLVVIDLEAGRSWSSLVSHGSGSDPDRTGWVERLSNLEGSNASCEGAFLTSEMYEGRHGRSQRLIGLDRTNDRALERAIVIHGAWYAEPDIVRRTGALGRSQGCFAVGDSVLDGFLSRLGRDRLIVASKA